MAGVTPERFNRGVQFSSPSGFPLKTCGNDVLLGVRLQAKPVKNPKPEEVQTPMSMRASACNTSFVAFFTESWMVSLLSSSPCG
jgi:hypothetical protein